MVELDRLVHSRTPPARFLPTNKAKVVDFSTNSSCKWLITIHGIGLTFVDLGKIIGRDETWVAAAIYGQVCIYFVLDIATPALLEQAKFSPEELEKLSVALELDLDFLKVDIGEQWWPDRGLGEMPPRDPVIYRLFEVRHLPHWLSQNHTWTDMFYF